jgi:hypothetical protein
MKPNMIHDLWKYVQVGSEDACWPWLGGLGNSGYGKARVHDRSTRLAHVLIFEAATGIRPKDMVLHKCNNKPCCNPKHLFEGNASDNQIHHSLTQQPTKSNTGVKGITFNRRRNQFQVTVDSGKTFLYRGPDFNEARRARSSWEAQQRERLIQDTTSNSQDTTYRIQDT